LEEKIMNENLKALNTKWGWLCEDIKNPEVRKNTMLVLENSAKFMVENEHTTKQAVQDLFEEFLTEAESTNPNTSGYEGSNGTVGSSTRNGVQNYVVPKVMFPVIRRVMPQLIANELVSVQPINGRTGVVFYASYQFSNDKGGVASGDQFTGNYTIDELGDFSDLRANGGQAIRGQAFYSSQKCGPFDVVTVPELKVAFDGTNYTVTLNGDTITGATNAFQPSVDTLLEKFWKDSPTPAFLDAELYPLGGGPATTYTYSESAASATAYTYNSESGEGTVTFGASVNYAVVADTSVTIGSGDAIDITDLGLSEGESTVIQAPVTSELFVQYNQESSVNIPEMQFTLDSKNIETKERKLKVRYTQEAAQDLKAHHQLDLEAELVKMASTDMNYEIDREIIDFIDRSVPAQLKWSHNWNFAGSGIVYNFLDRHRALAQSLYALAGRMAQYNRQGAANWAVVSPKVAAILQLLPEFSKETVSLSPNIYTIGSLNKIRYFVDPNRVGSNEDTILMGFKSPITSYGTGIVYSPYANWMTATVIDPANFDSNKGFFSRYAITLLPRGQWFYAKLLITNLSNGFGG
jgi:hypothetical protein